MEQAISFEDHIRPLFREQDRRSMSFLFDLWSYDDVTANAEAILRVLEGGSMPCDGAWDAAGVDLFRRWARGARAS